MATAIDNVFYLERNENKTTIWRTVQELTASSERHGFDYACDLRGVALWVSEGEAR